MWCQILVLRLFHHKKTDLIIISVFLLLVDCQSGDRRHQRHHVLVHIHPKGIEHGQTIMEKAFLIAWTDHLIKGFLLGYLRPYQLGNDLRVARIIGGKEVSEN